jgi:hypothetical protein
MADSNGRATAFAGEARFGGGGKPHTTYFLLGECQKPSKLEYASSFPASSRLPTRYL